MSRYDESYPSGSLPGMSSNSAKRLTLRCASGVPMFDGFSHMKRLPLRLIHMKLPVAHVAPFRPKRPVTSPGAVNVTP